MKYIKLFCCLVLEYMEKKIYNVKVLLNNLICVVEVDDYGKK